MEIRCAPDINDAVNGTGRCIHDPNRRVHSLRPFCTQSRGGIKLPDLVRRCYGDVESAHDVKFVVNHRKPTGQDCACGIARPVVLGAERFNRVAYRIVAKHARSSRRLSGCRATNTIDVGRSRFGKYTTRHVVDLVVRIDGIFRGPDIRCRVILKRLSEIAAPDVGRASAHSVKLPVRWEINSNQANAETWEVATR